MAAQPLAIERRGEMSAGRQGWCPRGRRYPPAGLVADGTKTP